MRTCVGWVWLFPKVLGSQELIKCECEDSWQESMFSSSEGRIMLKCVVVSLKNFCEHVTTKVVLGVSNNTNWIRWMASNDESTEVGRYKSTTRYNIPCTRYKSTRVKESWNSRTLVIWKSFIFQRLNNSCVRGYEMMVSLNSTENLIHHLLDIAKRYLLAF